MVELFRRGLELRSVFVEVREGSLMQCSAVAGVSVSETQRLPCVQLERRGSQATVNLPQVWVLGSILSGDRIEPLLLVAGLRKMADLPIHGIEAKDRRRGFDSELAHALSVTNSECIDSGVIANR